MGCFGPKTYGMPPGNPSGWTARDVKHFLKHSNLEAYKGAFAHCDGKALIGYEKKRMERLVGASACAAVMPAVNALRHKWGQPILQDPKPEPAPQPAPVEPEVVEEVAAPEPTYTRLIISDRATQESVADGAPVIIINSAPQGPRDWAEKLVPFTGVSADAIIDYLQSLGKGLGGGLVEAVEKEAAVGDVFGAAYGLYNKAQTSTINRENCYKAAGLGQDVLRILDAAWRRHTSGGGAPCEGSFLRKEGLAAMATTLLAMGDLVAPYTQKGWLLHAICNEKMKETFDNGHNAVVDALKEEGLETLPGGRALGRGDYRDVSRGVRRLVRQHGSGSITKGVLAIKAQATSESTESEAVRELGGQLELGAEELKGLVEELGAVPSDIDVDIDVYFANLVGGNTDAASYGAVFDYYDRNCDGVIDAAEYRAVLQDLGLLEGRNDADTFAAASFKAADKAGTGSLSREAFGAVYATLATSRARQQLRTRMGLHAEEELRSLFTSFASFGARVEVTDMDNAHFAKLAKDCELLNDKLTSVDVDIIFTKAKAKGARRMNFDQFLTALSLCADKKGVSFEEAVRGVIATGGPVARATRPENVRLHDDKSTYTGVYAKGGPKAVDAPKNDLSQLVDRTYDADVRGVKKTPLPKPPLAAKNASLSARKPPMASPPPADLFGGLRTSIGGAGLSLSPLPTMSHVKPDRRRSSLGGAGTGNELLDMFNAFASFGASNAGAAPVHAEMDSAKFAKLCRECKLIDGKFNSTRADLVFAKLTAQYKQEHKAQRLTFADFQKALELVATEKGVGLDIVRASVCNSDGPLLTRVGIRG